MDSADSSPYEYESFLNLPNSSQQPSGERMPCEGGSRSRNFCFTINNPCAESAHTQKDSCSPLGKTTSTSIVTSTTPFLNCSSSLYPIKICVWQLEKGSSGTIHVQGYIEMKSPQRFSTMKTLLPKAHLEKRNGSRHQAINYVTKEETRESGPWIYPEDQNLQDLMDKATRGLMSKSEKKHDDFINKIKKGADDEQLSKEHPSLYLRYLSCIDKIRLKYVKERDWKMQVLVLQGPSGCGKSFYCKQNFPGAYYKMGDDWWDGYFAHETVVLDDFYGGWIKLGCFLKLIDEYPYQVRVKGGTRQFVAKTICITTNTVPDQWYKKYFAAIERRVTTWIVWDANGNKFIHYKDYGEARKQMIDYHLQE